MIEENEVAADTEDRVRAVLRERMPLALGDDPMERNGQIRLGHAHRAALVALLERCRRDSPGLAETVRTWADVFDWYGESLADGIRDDVFTADSSPRVRIRPLQPSDIPTLYAAAADPVLGYRWRYRGRTPSFAEFEGSIFDGVLAQFAVTQRESGAVCGMVTVYNADLANGHAFLGVIRGARAAGDQGSMMDGCILLIQHAFTSWPLRKVYFELPGYNMRLVDGLIEAGFAVEEGRLKEFFFRQGEFFDKVFVAIHRQTWVDRMGSWF